VVTPAVRVVAVRVARVVDRLLDRLHPRRSQTHALPIAVRLTPPTSNDAAPAAVPATNGRGRCQRFDQGGSGHVTPRR
jgi:hypothetical protein